jgi:hypothetical protein
MRMIPLGGRQIESRDQENDIADERHFLTKVQITLCHGVSFAEETPYTVQYSPSKEESIDVVLHERGRRSRDERVEDAKKVENAALYSTTVSFRSKVA